MNQTNILVVDDDQYILKIIKSYLEEEGYQIFTAANGRIALELMESRSELFSLVLLDLIMPEMDGIEFLQIINQKDRYRDIPIIMQTSLQTDEQINLGIKAGAYYSLTKPFERNVLITIVKVALSDYQRYSTLQEEVRKGVRLARLMKNCQFKYQNLREAEILSTFIANACPEPERRITGLWELLLNAVEHGNLGITYEEKGQLQEQLIWQKEIERRLTLTENLDKYVTVGFERLDDSIRIRIQDQGQGFDWKSYLDFSPDRVFDTHGRGIAMARRMSFENLEYLGNGNTIVLSIALLSKINPKF